MSLFAPTFFIELSAVGQNDASVAVSINIGVNKSSIIGRKRDGDLPGRNAAEQPGHEDESGLTQAANFTTVAGLWSTVKEKSVT